MGLYVTELTSLFLQYSVAVAALSLGVSSIIQKQTEV